MSQPNDHPPTLNQSDQSELFRMRRDYGDRYHITVNGDGLWSAFRLGNALKRVSGESPVELRARLSIDLQKWEREARGDSQ